MNREEYRLKIADLDCETLPIARLAEYISGAGRKIVESPGARLPENLQFGPFNEAGSLVGVPIRIGGKNDPVPVHLRDTDGTIHECLARLDVAERLAKFMFRTPVRAEGVGRWRREASGEWLLEKFTIKDFEPLSAEKLSETIARLRENPPEWADENDPLGMLKELRTG